VSRFPVLMQLQLVLCTNYTPVFLFQACVKNFSFQMGFWDPQESLRLRPSEFVFHWYVADNCFFCAVIMSIYSAYMLLLDGSHCTVCTSICLIISSLLVTSL